MKRNRYKKVMSAKNMLSINIFLLTYILSGISQNLLKLQNYK